MPITKRNLPIRSIIRRALAVSLTVALAGIAGVAIAQMSAPKSLPSLIPLDAEVCGTVQPKWIWDATSSIRTVPQVAKALSDFQAKTGFSIDNDFLPWVGQFGFAGFHLPDESKRMVIAYAQIVDQDKFQAMVSSVQANAPAQSITITSRDYNGTTVYDVSHPNKKAPCAYAVLNGWAVLGIGKGAIEHAIDVYDGRSPAIDTSSAWQTASSRLPQQSVGWAAINFGYLNEDLLATKATTADVASMPQSKLLMAFALTDLGNGLRTDVVSAPTTPAAQAYLATFAQHMHPLTGKLLKRVPDSVMVLEATNPSFLWNIEQTAMQSSQPAGSGEQQMIMQSIMQGLKPLGDILPYFQDDAGVCITWRADRGFGLVTTGQTDSQPTALHAAKLVANMLKQYGIPLQRGGNSWVLAVPGLDAMMPSTMPVKLEPFMSAKDNWLVIGSHPMWTSPPLDSPALQIPAAAGSPSSYSAATFQWLPSVLNLIEQQPGIPDQGKQAIDLARDLHIENSKWQAWGSVDSSGISVGTAEVTDWDWRTAISNAAKAVSSWNPSDTQNKSKGGSLDISQSKTPVKRSA